MDEQHIPVLMLPLGPSRLAKWCRFAARGGIGVAIAHRDTLAQTPNDLMFLSGDTIVVLMRADAAQYLGYCEGVVGLFHEDSVTFPQRLKRPVYTRSRHQQQDDFLAARIMKQRHSVLNSNTHDEGYTDEEAEIFDSYRYSRSDESSIPPAPSSSTEESSQDAADVLIDIVSDHRPPPVLNPRPPRSTSRRAHMRTSSSAGESRPPLPYSPSSSNHGIDILNNLNNLSSHNRRLPPRLQFDHLSSPSTAPTSPYSPSSPFSSSSLCPPSSTPSSFSLSSFPSSDTSSNKPRTPDHLDPPKPFFNSSLVVQLGNDEFEIVRPQVPLSASNVTDVSSPPSRYRTISSENISEKYDSRYGYETETDCEGLTSSVSSSPYVERLSDSAKRRARQTFIAENPPDIMTLFGTPSPTTPIAPSAPRNSQQAETHRIKETKWLKILSSSNVNSKVRKNKKLKQLVRSGIPSGLRPRVWLYLAGVQKQIGYYEILKNKPNPPCYDEIEKDLHRTFPQHEMFKDPIGQGRIDLAYLLKAYALHNPSVGYCQGMAMIAGLLLTLAPAEDAFWLLVAIIGKTEEWYKPGMHGMLVDTFVLNQLLHYSEPKIAKKLDELQVYPSMWATSWLIPLFSTTLPWNTLLCVIDCFLLDGCKFLFRVVLAIFEICRDIILSSNEDNVLSLLQNPPSQLLGPQDLLPVTFCIKVKNSSLRKLSRQARVLHLQPPQKPLQHKPNNTTVDILSSKTTNPPKKIPRHRSLPALRRTTN